MNNNLKSISNSMIILSILAIIIGIVMLFQPAKAIYIIALLLGIHFIVQGIAQIAFGIRVGGSYIAFGVLSLLLGIVSLVVFVSRPEVTVVTFGIIIGVALGIWIIITGFYDIKASMDLKNTSNSMWGLILAFGIISIILGLCLITTPFATGIFSTMFDGIMLIVFGFVKLIDSISLRSKA